MREAAQVAQDIYAHMQPRRLRGRTKKKKRACPKLSSIRGYVFVLRKKDDLSSRANAKELAARRARRVR